MSKADGSYMKGLARLKRQQPLILDDFGALPAVFSEMPSSPVENGIMAENRMANPSLLPPTPTRILIK
jgi:hypothetical protein